MKRTGPTNQNVKRLILELNRASASESAPIWKRVADDLAMSSRNHRVINLSRLNHVAQSSQTLIIPGKVLGTGDVPTKLTVAALSFSKSAQHKIAEAQGKCITIEQLMKNNPKGSNLRIIG